MFNSSNEGDEVIYVKENRPSHTCIYTLCTIKAFVEPNRVHVENTQSLHLWFDASTGIKIHQTPNKYLNEYIIPSNEHTLELVALVNSHDENWIKFSYGHERTSHDEHNKYISGWTSN